MARAEAASGYSVTCESCTRSVDRQVYQVRTANRSTLRCLTCALRHGGLVRRSLAVAAVVGSILVAINQGDVIAGGDASASLAWKLPLTYAVPYCVATFGAIMNARREVRPDQFETTEGGNE